MRRRVGRSEIRAHRVRGVRVFRVRGARVPGCPGARIVVCRCQGIGCRVYLQGGRYMM